MVYDIFLQVYDQDSARNSDKWRVNSSWTAFSRDGNKQIHEGPVCKVCWAHPEYGQVFASGSLDGMCCIWTEEADKQTEVGKEANGEKLKWQLSASFKVSRTAILDLKFSPPQHGLRLAISTEDGYIRLYNAEDIFHCSDWQLTQEFQLDASEKCQSICWRPFSANMPQMLLLGSSKSASIWCFEEALGRWKTVSILCTNTSVADVDWANTCGKTYELVAYASGKDVYIVELKDNLEQLDVNIAAHCSHDHEVVQVEWNKFGTTLATSANGSIQLWRSDLVGEWHEMAQMRE